MSTTKSVEEKTLLQEAQVFGEGDNQDTYSVTGGPFVSYLWQASQKLGVSVGLLADITSPEVGDTIAQLVPGVNLGFSLTDNWALNTYIVGYYEIDAAEYVDDTYADGGIEVAFSKGIWDLSFGVKKTFALDNYEATEIYLGSDWRF